MKFAKGAEGPGVLPGEDQAHQRMTQLVAMLFSSANAMFIASPVGRIQLLKAFREGRRGPASGQWKNTLYHHPSLK
jgi:hypothetical protein